MAHVSGSNAVLEEGTMTPSRMRCGMLVNLGGVE